MLEAVSWYAIYFVMHLLDCYIFSKFVKEKLKIEIKHYFFIGFFSIFETIIQFNSAKIDEVLNMIISNLITFIILKIVCKKNSSKTLLGTLFTYIGYAVSELFLYIISICLFNIDVEYYTNNFIGIVIGNTIVFTLYYLIFKIPFLIKFVAKIIKWYDEKKFLSLMVNTIIIVLFSYIILFPIAYNKLFLNNHLLIICVFLGIIIFVIGFFNEKSNNNQLTIKYDNLLDYVKDYELEVVEKGKAIHEHKNQLAVIDDMIPKSNKKLKEYVSEKLDKVSKLDDNVWLEKLTNLPTGGTKGLVYLKIKKMLDSNISIYVEIDDDLKTKNKWNNVSKNLEDYTRILGVYLDNAIEASIESKDKQIIIEFIDNEDNIEFILSNTYKGRINVEEIDKEKYSTKGKGRGYGLSLVKDIIENNKYISQSREVNGKFYVQKLCIKK